VFLSQLSSQTNKNNKNTRNNIKRAAEFSEVTLKLFGRGIRLGDDTQKRPFLLFGQTWHDSGSAENSLRKKKLRRKRKA
jgi:hypothetical protein